MKMSEKPPVSQPSSGSGPRLCLVCSPGGHFIQLWSLKEWWEDYDRFWVTGPGPAEDYLLRGEVRNIAHFPTNRNLPNLIRNLLLAWRVLKKERPSTLVSTGAGVSLPFILAARLLGIKTVYLESLTRVKSLSLSGRLAAPFVDHLLVQWEGLARKRKKAVWAGRLI